MYAAHQNWMVRRNYKILGKRESINFPVTFAVIAIKTILGAIVTIKLLRDSKASATAFALGFCAITHFHAEGFIIDSDESLVTIIKIASTI